MSARRTILRTALAGILSTAATLTAPGTGIAAPSYSAVAEVRLLDSPTTVIQNDDLPVTAFAADVGGPAGSHAAPTALATVDTAGIHLTAVATAQVLTASGPVQVYSSSEARGGFSDRFVLSAPGLAGTTGSVTVAFTLTGAPSLSGGPTPVPDGQGWGSAARWRAHFELLDNADGVMWDGDGFFDLDSANYLTGGSATLGTRFFTIPFVFGHTLDVRFSGTAEARAGAGAVFPGVPASLVAHGSMLLGNTIAWGGITQVLDASGAPVTSFTATSPDTGFDYAHAYVPIPEPAAGTLLLKSLAGAASLFSRRNPRPAVTSRRRSGRPA